MKNLLFYFQLFTALFFIQSSLVFNVDEAYADISIRPKHLKNQQVSPAPQKKVEENLAEQTKEETVEEKVEEKIPAKIVFSTNKISHDINSLEFTQEFAISGFNLPESTTSKSDTNWVYISNVNTSNDTGFISRVKKNGEDIEMNWLTGLTQPTGMLMKGRSIYVASQEKIYIVDSTRAKVTDTLKPKNKNIKNINAIALATDGTLYASDIISGKILKQDGENLIEWFQSDIIKNPNALALLDNKLYVATYGSLLSKNLEPEQYGSIYSIDLFTRELKLLNSSYKLGAIESLHAYNNGFIATSATGKIYYIDEHNRILLLTLSEGITDAYMNNDMLFAVYLKHNRLVAFKVEKKK